MIRGKSSALPSQGTPPSSGAPLLPFKLTRPATAKSGKGRNSGRLERNACTSTSVPTKRMRGCRGHQAATALQGVQLIEAKEVEQHHLGHQEKDQRVADLGKARRR